MRWHLREDSWKEEWTIDEDVCERQLWRNALVLGDDVVWVWEEPDGWYCSDSRAEVEEFLEQSHGPYSTLEEVQAVALILGAAHVVEENE